MFSLVMEDEMNLSERIRAAHGEKEWSGDAMLDWVDEVTQLEAALTVIRDVSYDRDGHTGDSVKLGELVDEIYKYAVDALKEG